MRIKITIGVIVSLIIAIAADSQGLFGYSEDHQGDYLHLTFQFVDAATRAPVQDVHIICMRDMNRASCTETQGPDSGQTTLTLSVIKVTRRSVLFAAAPRYELGSEGILNLTFVSPNHTRKTLAITNDDPILSAGRPHRVELSLAAQ